MNKEFMSGFEKTSGIRSDLFRTMKKVKDYISSKRKIFPNVRAKNKDLTKEWAAMSKKELKGRK